MHKHRRDHSHSNNTRAADNSQSSEEQHSYEADLKAREHEISRKEHQLEYKEQQQREEQRKFLLKQEFNLEKQRLMLNFENYNNTAHMLSMQKRYPEAILQFEQAINLMGQLKKKWEIYQRELNSDNFLSLFVSVPKDTESERAIENVRLEIANCKFLIGDFYIAMQHYNKLNKNYVNHEIIDSKVAECKNAIRNVAVELINEVAVLETTESIINIALAKIKLHEAEELFTRINMLPCNDLDFQKHRINWDEQRNTTILISEQLIKDKDTIDDLKLYVRHANIHLKSFADNQQFLSSREIKTAAQLKIIMIPIQKRYNEQLQREQRERERLENIRLQQLIHTNILPNAKNSLELFDLHKTWRLLKDARNIAMKINPHDIPEDLIFTPPAYFDASIAKLNLDIEDFNNRSEKDSAAITQKIIKLVLDHKQTVGKQEKAKLYAPEEAILINHLQKVLIKHWLKFDRRAEFSDSLLTQLTNIISLNLKKINEVKGWWYGTADATLWFRDIETVKIEICRIVKEYIPSTKQTIVQLPIFGNATYDDDVPMAVPVDDSECAKPYISSAPKNHV